MCFGKQFLILVLGCLVALWLHGGRRVCSRTMWWSRAVSSTLCTTPVQCGRLLWLFQSEKGNKSRRKKRGILYSLLCCILLETSTLLLLQVTLLLLLQAAIVPASCNFYLPLVWDEVFVARAWLSSPITGERERQTCSQRNCFLRNPITEWFTSLKRIVPTQWTRFQMHARFTLNARSRDPYRWSPKVNMAVAVH